jgi:cytochrome c556
MNCKRLIPIIIIVVGVFGTCFVGISAAGQTKPTEGMNLLREEMVALEQAFQTIIDAVIFANMGLIKPAAARFHKARKKIEEAISAGQRITLPKNQVKFKEFVELDDKFHDCFRALEKAAEKGQKKIVKDQTHKLLDNCVVCHEGFRK